MISSFNFHIAVILLLSLYLHASQIMKKLVRHIRRNFLLTAGMVIILHMIVPHDHHADALSDINSGSCPYTNQHHSFPVHCHALNDLLPEKLHNVLNYNVFNSQFFINPHDFLKDTGEQHTAGTPFQRENDKLISVTFLSESLLRAPPLNS